MPSVLTEIFQSFVQKLSVLFFWRIPQSTNASVFIPCYISIFVVKDYETSPKLASIKKKVHTTTISLMIYRCISVSNHQFLTLPLLTARTNNNWVNISIFMYYQTSSLMKRLHFTKFLTRKSTCKSAPLQVTTCLKQSNFCSADNKL